MCVRIGDASSFWLTIVGPTLSDVVPWVLGPHGGKE